MRLGPPDADDCRTGLTRLTSGELPWPEPDGAGRYPTLTDDATCDVAVVGAGITGAMCAALLVDAGLDVVLLERRTVASGSTSANTALLLFEPDQPLHRLIGLIGDRDATTVYRLAHQAMDDIARLAHRSGGVAGSATGTGFTWRPSLILASRAEDVDPLRREHAARERHGYPNALLDSEALEARYGFHAPAALRTGHAAEMDPHHFTAAVVADSAHRGLRVHEGTDVVGYQTAGDRAELTMASGRRVRARQVVFATGYETERYTTRKLARDNATYAILTQPLESVPGWPDAALVWETARPYIYLRTTPDGRILIGGLDEETVDADRRDAMLPEKSQALLERLRRMRPGIDAEVARAWTGTFLTTRDSLPYIGQLPGMPHAWFALAYGGNGTTFGMMAARLLRDSILGSPPEAMRIFRFDRPTAGGGNG